MVRRFRCDAVLCGRQLFAERFGDGALAPLARRTGRLDDIVHHLGLALGGRPATAFAARLMTPVSNDTLLRVVRRRARLPTNPLAVIGIDDFAWRRNHRYGTIVCDLERRQPGNCSACGYVEFARGVPARVRRIASRASIERRRAVSMTERMSA
jgi:hypothetical protein